MSAVFPWGDREPEGGFQVGDHVGLIYSDHDEYVFDNPTGVVTAVEHVDDGDDWVTVQVEASIDAGRVFLIGRSNTSSSAEAADLSGVFAEINAVQRWQQRRAE